MKSILGAWSQERIMTGNGYKKQNLSATPEIEDRETKLSNALARRREKSPPSRSVWDPVEASEEENESTERSMRTKTGGN
jgi:hypothetical protein